MLTRRLQVLIEPTQYELLRRTAKVQGVSVGELVRIGIGRVCGPDPAGREQALSRLLEAPPVELPEDPAELERELDGLLDPR